MVLCFWVRFTLFVLVWKSCVLCGFAVVVLSNLTAVRVIELLERMSILDKIAKHVIITP